MAMTTTLEKLFVIARLIQQIKNTGLINKEELNEADLILDALIAETKVKAASTRQLLEWLNHTRIGFKTDISADDIKAELSTREHVMSKAESKEHRRKIAQLKKSR